MQALIITLFLSAFLSACCTYTYFYLMKPDQILHFWAKLLEKLPKGLSKPLGLCPFCTNFYVATVVWFVALSFYPPPPELSFRLWGPTSFSIGIMTLYLSKTSFSLSLLLWGPCFAVSNVILRQLFHADWSRNLD